MSLRLLPDERMQDAFELRHRAGVCKSQLAHALAVHGALAIDQAGAKVLGNGVNGRAAWCGQRP